MWLTLGAWEQLEPLGKLFPVEMGSTGSQASQGLHFYESSQPGAQQAGRACPTRAQLPALTFLCCSPWPSQALSEEKSSLQWSGRAGGLGQLLPAGAHLGPWV